MIGPINGKWFAALRVPDYGPEKRKAHWFEAVGLSARRTISGNGRCVGLNFGTNAKPL